MRRFGDAERFLELLDGRFGPQSPQAGARSNFIVGFPGETEDDVEMLGDFLAAARLDAIGIFGYSDEDGTEAVGLDGHLDDDEIRARRRRTSHALAEELTAQRAEERLGEQVDVLVEQLDGPTAEGRAECQGPEVDGIDHAAATCRRGVTDRRPRDAPRGRRASGVDLVAVAVKAIGCWDAEGVGCSRATGTYRTR